MEHRLASWLESDGWKVIYNYFAGEASWTNELSSR
jgi:hypothetical protein